MNVYVTLIGALALSALSRTYDEGTWPWWEFSICAMILYVCATLLILAGGYTRWKRRRKV